MVWSKTSATYILNRAKLKVVFENKWDEDAHWRSLKAVLHSKYTCQFADFDDDECQFDPVSYLFDSVGRICVLYVVIMVIGDLEHLIHADKILFLFGRS